MRGKQTLLALLACLGAGPSLAHAEQNGVLLELFTSEGCSSCPPADRQLAQLAAGGAQDGAKLIALEWHVDYWNYLGWADPFSAASYTARQQGYAQALAAAGGRVYTPQLVIDGRFELIGSNGQRAREVIAQQAQSANANKKARLTLAQKGEQLSIAIAPPAEGAVQPGELWLAVTESGLTTAVLRGENAGQKLAHGPVVRAMRKLANVQTIPFQTTVQLELKPGWRVQNLHAVALLQQPGAGGPVLGAAELQLAAPAK